MTRVRAVTIALIASIVATAAPTAAQDVIQSEAFAPLARVSAGRTGLDAGDEAGGGFRRRSIDEQLVIAIIQDRARQFAITSLTSVLTSASGAAQRAYIRDVLLAATRLLGSSHVLRTAALEDLAKTILRALVAEAVVRVQFGDDRRIVNANLDDASPGPWYRRFGQPVPNETRAAAAARDWVPPTGTDPVLLRAYLVSWAYWAIGYETWLEASTHDAPVACPFANGARGGEICARLNRGAGEPLRRSIAAFFRLDDLTQAIEIARTLYMRYRETGRVDLGQVIEALAGWSQQFADFGAMPGLRLVEDFGPIAGVARLADALAGLRSLPTLVAPSGGGSTSVGDFAAAPRRAQALAVLLCGASDDATERGWRNVMSNHVTLPTAAPADAVCARLREIQGWEPGRPWTFAGSELAALQSNAAFAQLRQLARDMAQTFPTIIEALHEARERFEAVLRATSASGDLQGVRLEALPALANAALGLVTKANEALEAYVALFPAGPLRASMLQMSDALARVRGVLTMLVEVAPHLSGGDTVGRLRAVLRSLVGRTEAGNRVAIVFEIIEPVIAELTAGRPLSRATLVSLVAGVRPAQVLAAMGIEGDSTSLCAADAESAHCWTARMVEVLLASIRTVDGNVTLDGDRLMSAAATMGDDFSRNERTRFFIHATIGIGGLYSNLPGAEPARTVPIVAEQLGFGIAHPLPWGNAKLALFGSGILYRILLDNRETDAISAGLTLATDIGELLELYVAGQLMFYPPEGMETSTQVQTALSFGVQIPLGDYLSRVAEGEE